MSKTSLAVDLAESLKELFHNLRGDISTISNELHFLKTKLENPEEANLALKSVKSFAERLTEISTNLADNFSDDQSNLLSSLSSDFINKTGLDALAVSIPADNMSIILSLLNECFDALGLKIKTKEVGVCASKCVLSFLFENNSKVISEVNSLSSMYKEKNKQIDLNCLICDSLLAHYKCEVELASTDNGLEFKSLIPIPYAK